MQVKVGNIYRVKKGCENRCLNYKNRASATFIKITLTGGGNLEYDILSKDKNKIGECSCCFKPEHLEPEARTLRDAVPGDIIVNKNDDERKVFFANEYIVFYSWFNKFTQDGGCSTWEQLEEYGYKLKGQEEEVDELTMDELCKELGRTVKIKK